MQSEYVSDLEHRYLVLTGDEPVDREAFQVQMLLGSYVPSLLDCRLQGLNGKDRFYYEITGMRSLMDWAGEKSLSFEKLRLLLLQLVDLFEEMQEYLMSPSFLVLGMEYIYMDPEKNKAFFCFLPGFGQEVGKQFTSLAEELIRFTDPADPEGTELGFCVYRKAMEGEFRPEMLRETVCRLRGSCERMPRVQPVKPDEEYVSHTAEIQAPSADERIPVLEKEKPKERKRAGRLIFCLLLTIILFLLLLGSVLEILPRIPAVGSMIFLGVFLVLMLVMEQMKREPGERKKAADREKAVQRYWMVPGNGNPESAFLLEQDLVLIGSRPKVCDVVLSERYAEPVHARIRIKKEGCFLADLTGRGDTGVGERILQVDEEYRLKDGDEVRIGRLSYRFTVK